jgi:hypothetical protein
MIRIIGKIKDEKMTNNFCKLTYSTHVSPSQTDNIISSGLWAGDFVNITSKYRKD